MTATVYEGFKPFRKVTLADADVKIPGTPYFGHGATTTLADDGHWQSAIIARMLAEGASLVSEWWVDQCANGCGRLLTVAAEDVGMVVCRDCGIADMEAKHGGDWDVTR